VGSWREEERVIWTIVREMDDLVRKTASNDNLSPLDFQGLMKSAPSSDSWSDEQLHDKHRGDMPRKQPTSPLASLTHSVPDEGEEERKGSDDLELEGTPNRSYRHIPWCA
jgi:hypothetical protein